MRAVVIGGGIIGAASSYYLSKNDLEVILVEKENLGNGNTGKANGGIRAQFSSQVNAELSKKSIEVWEEFEGKFGIEISYRRPGYLFLAQNDETADQLEENVEKQRRLGIDSRLLSQNELERFSVLNHKKFIAGAYSPEDGFADPHSGLQGFSNAAQSEGVDIRTHTPVIGISQDDQGRISGVKTENGQIECEYVVNATGVWAAKTASMVGLDLPVTPKRRKLMVTDPEVPIDASTPFTIDHDNGVHFRPEREGSVVCGGHFDEQDPDKDPENYSEGVDLEWSAKVIEGLSQVSTNFGPETKIKRGWAGLYAVTPDHHPIIEETLPGFVNVVGFSGHGFMQSPAAGKLVSELIVDDEPSTVDVSMLTLERFQRGDYLREGTVID